MPLCSRTGRLRLLPFTLLCCTLPGLAATPRAPRPKVVVISLDAFGAESLHEPRLPDPELRALMQQGAWAASMQPINPTVTWPNHTAMVTGVNASEHHVVVNGLVGGQRGDTPPKVDVQAPKSKLVAVPTIYDAAHAAGLTTAEVDWVAIMHADGITWSFAERPDPDSLIAQELIRQGKVTRDELATFGEGPQAWRDRIYTNAAVDIIRRHHPDLLLVHLLALDSIEHQTGFGNNSGRNTIAFLDDRVKEIVDAVRAGGDAAHTTFLIVSDHGQETVHHHLYPQLLLHQAGLNEGAQPAFCMPDGGFGLVYQKGATPDSIAALKHLFEGKPGIRAALTPDEAAKDGWPTPARSDQAPDLLLYAENDYAFAGGPSTSFVQETAARGAHGYPNTEPLMQAIFIAAGAGIRPVGEIPAFPNVDIAPTIARLLHLELRDVQGKPLSDILRVAAPETKTKH